ncbi:MAG: TonB family protein, partial [Myxococcaceae bacterium]
AHVRYCYESALQRAPGLEGKVMVKFVISSAGQVVSATVSSSTVSNDALESCITTRVRTWRFPKPQGGGIVVVSYPFVFKYAGP